MNRKRDPKTPKDITNEQRRSISCHPRLIELRKERVQLRVEKRSMVGGGYLCFQTRREDMPQEITLPHLTS
jgi:hypothetical protein